MASPLNSCAFQQISPAAVYNTINVWSQSSRLLFLDVRSHPSTAFPSAILPPTGLSDNTSDLSILLSCLRAHLSHGKKLVAHRCIVLFIEEYRFSALENEIAAPISDSFDAEMFALFTEWKKFCCFNIDELFSFVPLQFISAALAADVLPRVPSLMECLLPRKLFVCERKLVHQALNPTSGLGISSVLNVTSNPPVHRPDITHSFPIEDTSENDIEAGTQPHSALLEY
jgi:hypothetical protein